MSDLEQEYSEAEVALFEHLSTFLLPCPPGDKARAYDNTVRLVARWSELGDQVKAQHTEPSLGDRASDLFDAVYGVVSAAMLRRAAVDGETEIKAVPDEIPLEIAQPILDELENALYSFSAATMMVETAWSTFGDQVSDGAYLAGEWDPEDYR